MKFRHSAFLAVALAVGSAIYFQRPSARSSGSPAAPKKTIVSEVAPPALSAAPVLASSPLDESAPFILEPKVAPDVSKIAAFHNWTAQWQAADAAGREAMKAEGVRLAQARRPEFKALIVADPKAALDQAVPRVVRQDLPADIVAYLEKPVSATGSLAVYRGRPQQPVPEGTELTVRYFETPDGSSYKARVFGALEPLNSREKIPMRGVAVDREFAVAENGVRRLEVGERIPKGTVIEDTCPVSGIVTPMAADDEPVDVGTPVIEVAEKVIRLCNGSHVAVLETEYTAMIQASGPGGAGIFADAFPGTSSAAIGNFKCLYIRVTYPDQMKAPNTEEAAYSDMRNVSRFYLESSFGKMTTTTTVTPLLVLPHSQAWYIAKDSEVDGLGLVHSHSRAEAKKLGYHDSQYTCIIVRVNGGPRLSGISWGGGSSVWVSWDGMDVLNHECGHSLGRNHANFWASSDGTGYGNGANSEYGNPYDVMGGGGGFGAHYNTISKRSLGWLPDVYFHRPDASQNANGSYRIFAYDQPQLEEGKRYGFRVTKDAVREYYIEYHPAMSNFTDSATVLYRISGASNCGHLIDTTPTSSGGKGDGGIQIGRTFSDWESDQHFTVTAKNTTTPPSLDLNYQRGPFPGNQRPAVNLTASATSIAVNGSITFNTNATDPDGDALAYRWEFQDGYVSTNTPTLTRNFTTTDQMTVMVSVSDMKGGVTRDHIVVTIGNPGRAVITGNITAGGQPLKDVLVTADTGKFAYTDNDGNYAVSDLQTGARTLTAVLNGYAFTAGFTNPLTVTVAGPNVANWTADATVKFVTITKTADAAEGGANGSFTITRTGDTTDALVVRLAPQTGSATLTTDYTFLPALATDGSFRSVEIPAGQSSLTLEVVPVNDTTAEGPETVALQPVMNGNYLVAAVNPTALIIADNDSALPKVSIAATDPYSSEAGDTGAFTIARTGATTNALNVTVAWSGTATNTTDYATQPTTVTIPAGQSSTLVTLTPVNDTAIEGPEDATLTISSNNAVYLREATTAATVNITDDDAPVVSVTAFDANASEAGTDPGVVLITRTGSTAATLKVYYGLSGRALHGTDYQALNGEITFPIGATSVPVFITPYDDDLGEPDPESVTFQLATFLNQYSLGTNYTATVNIADNDDIPVVSVRAGTTPTEPSTAGTFIFHAIASATGNISVNYTISGTATSGADFTAPSGSISVPATGSTDTTLSIPILNDALVENSETITITITPGAGYRVYGDGTATLRLRDDDSTERVMVSTWNQSPTEAGATGKFYFSRAGSVGDLAVTYAISGTATNGTDYTTLSGTVTIPDTMTGVDVTLTPTDDADVEGTETVTVTVVPDVGYVADIPATATYTIADSETPTPTVGFEFATGSTSETPVASSEFRDIAVTLSPVSATETVTVEYTGAGGTASGDDTDWAFVDAANGNAIIPGGTLTFPPNSASQLIRIRVKNDGVSEPSETAILTLKNAQHARISSTRTTHTLTITDAENATPRVRLLVAASSRGEGDISEPLLMAVMDRPSTSASTVQYTVGGTATSGSDYNLAPGTITFAAGETVKLLPFTILADGTPEPVETVIVTLTSPTNSTLTTPSTHTISISDSTLPVVEISGPAEVVENAGNATFTITRTGATTFPLTVNYTIAGTATAPDDYAALSGSVTIPIGASSAPLPAVLVDDTTEESDETIILTLAASAGVYNLGPVVEATTTIEDDDALPAVAITSPVHPEISIPAANGLMLIADATRATPSGTVNVPITWTMFSGPGTVTFEAANGTSVAAAFSANGTYELRATATYATTTVFDSVTVHVGPTIVAQTIGTTTAAGSFTETVPGTIALTGAGSGLSSTGTTDGFYFLGMPKTGDFDVKVRVASFTNPGASGSFRVGIMARASTAANAPYAMTMYKGAGTHSYQARLTAGTAPVTPDPGTTVYTMPRWLRLTRVGDVFTAYHGTDGTAWTIRGTAQTIPAMGTSPLLGLAITSAVVANASTATFDNADFYLPTNLGPNVNAGAALTGTGPWNLDATVTDDARPAPPTITPLWLPENGVTFTSASSVDTGVAFENSGTYTLRLTASDGAITTFDDTTATVTVSPLATWRQTHFGTTAGTGDAANLADPDGDGTANIIEYALLKDPTQPGSAPFAVATAAGQITLTLTRDAANADATITIESTTTLTAPSWTAIARSVSGAPFTSLAGDTTVGETGPGPITATISVPVAGTARYFRVKVETTTP